MSTYHQWNKYEIGFMRKNYSNFGAAYCSKNLNLSKSQVISFATRNKIKVKSQVKTNFLHSYFKTKWTQRDLLANELKIINPEQSYTLGFLWGDGYLMEKDKSSGRCYARIEMNSSDYYSICNFFGSFGKWINKQRRIKKENPLTYATLNDGVFGSFLKSNDYKIKSIVSPSKILLSIPNNLHEYFWRGFIDADGCFGWNKKSGYFHITGHYEQNWYDTENLLKNLGIKYKLERKSSYSGRISRINIYNKKGILLLGNYIYCHNTEISLSRKYIKFLEITGQQIFPPNIHYDVCHDNLLQ